MRKENLITNLLTIPALILGALGGGVLASMSVTPNPATIQNPEILTRVITAAGVILGTSVATAAAFSLGGALSRLGGVISRKFTQIFPPRDNAPMRL